MGAPQALIDQIDQVIAFFNKRRMDLPDGLFDKRAQFIVNGATFESLLSNAPNDPLIMMLSRGPAGYRFTAKALQHAIPEATIERGETETDGDPFKVLLKLWLSGQLRDSGEPINSLVAVTLRLTESGSVAVAEAAVDPADLDRIRRARLSS